MPSPAAGYCLWLEADVGAYQNTGLSTPCTANGDAFKGWADQSGNANNATDSTGGLYATNVLNGKPALQLDGTTHFLSGAVSQIDSATGITVFQVAQRISKVNETSEFSLRNTAGVDFNNSGTGIFSYEPTGADKLDVFTALFEGAGPSPAPSNGTPYIFAVTLDTNYNGYLGSRSTHFGPTSLGFTWGGGAGTLYTTARYGGASPSLGPNSYIFEIIVYPSVLSNADIDTTFTYLNGKYFTSASGHGPLLGLERNRLVY